MGTKDERMRGKDERREGMGRVLMNLRNIHLTNVVGGTLDDFNEVLPNGTGVPL